MKVLVVPKETFGRYKVSPAVLYIMQVRFGGLNDLIEDSKGKGFEDRNAMFFRGLIRSINYNNKNEGLREFIKELNRGICEFENLEEKMVCGKLLSKYVIWLKIEKDSY